MKMIIKIMTISLLLLVIAQSNAFSGEKTGDKPEPIKKSKVMFDFNGKDVHKLINVAFGTWEVHPTYTSEVWIARPVNKRELAERGKIIAVDYNLDYPEEELPYATYPVFNGVWFKLDDANLEDYDSVSLWMKADGKKGATSTCRLELKNNFGERGIYYLYGIDPTWRNFVIPISYFQTGTGKPIKDMSSMKELTIVFEKNHVDRKTGRVYIDDVGFEKGSKPSGEKGKIKRY